MARQILLVLKSEPRKLWKPNEIATHLRKDGGAVRKELKRLRRKTDYDGNPYLTYYPKQTLYRAFRDKDLMEVLEQPDVEIHAIQVSCRLPQNRGWGVRVAARQKQPGGLDWQQNQANQQFSSTYFWQDRRGAVTWTPSTATVQVTLHSNQRPLTFEGFHRWSDYIAGLLQGCGLHWIEAMAEIDNLELNRDYQKVALGGARRLMLGQFRNGWAQMYQKGEFRMRRELRIHKAEDELLTLAEARAILEPGPRGPLQPGAGELPGKPESGDVPAPLESRDEAPAWGDDGGMYQ